MSLIRPLSADETPYQDEILVRARLVTDGREFRLAVHTCIHVWEISHYLAKEMRRMGWGRIIRTHANLPLTIGGVDVPNTMGVERIVRRLKVSHHVMHVHIMQQDIPLFGKTKRAIRKAKRALGSSETQRSVHAIHSVLSPVPMEDPPVLSEPMLTVSEDVTLMEAAEHVEAAQMLQALSHTLHSIMNPPTAFPPTAFPPTAFPPTASMPTRMKHMMDEYQCM